MDHSFNAVLPFLYACIFIIIVFTPFVLCFGDSCHRIIRIELPSKAVGGTLCILDGVGRLVMQQRIANELTFVDSADWVKGAYYFQVESAEGVASGKLVR